MFKHLMYVFVHVSLFTAWTPDVLLEFVFKYV